MISNQDTNNKIIDKENSLKQNKPIVIALDGPGASGKGALGRRLADELHIQYLDTGKLYRAVGYGLLNTRYILDDIANNDKNAINKACEIAENIDINELNNSSLLCEEVARAASHISSLQSVRDVLMKVQRDIAESSSGAVLDGRDIGTVICPDADFKFFITADIEKRAERRYKELQKHNDNIIYADIMQDLETRDQRDIKKSISPLIPADDSVYIDTTSLNMEEVYNKVLSIILSDTSHN